jgi:hypothetical protein
LAGRIATVEFDSLSTRIAPQTWSQMHHFLLAESRGDEAHWYTLRRRITCPQNATVDQVEAAIRELFRRNEAIRTIFFRDISVGLCQTVKSCGLIAMPLIDAADEGLAPYEESLGYSIHRDRDELPVRFVAETVGDAVVSVYFAISHTAVDAWGADLLARQLSHLLHAGADMLTNCLQPYDRHLYESSDQGEKLHRRSADHWTTQARMLEPILPTVGNVSIPRFWRGSLTSAKLAVLLDGLARRLSATCANILLAAAGVAMCRQFNLDRISVQSLFNNRTGPYRDSVSCLAQWAILTVPDSKEGFARVVKEVSLASLRAYVRGTQYDPIRMEPLVATIPKRQFNYIQTTKRGIAEGNTDDLSEFQTRDESTFEWERQWHYRDPGVCGLTVFHNFRDVIITIEMDTALLSLADGEEIVRSMERIVTDFDQ